MLAGALVEVSLATGDSRFAERAKDLVVAAIQNGAFEVPGGADPVLVAHGLALTNDPSEGAYPSGLSAIANAALALDALGVEGAVGVDGLREVVVSALAPIAPLAVSRPISFGSTLRALSTLAAPHRQLVVVSENSETELAAVARGWTGGVVAVVTPAQAQAFADAGFELFTAREAIDGLPTAYLCENFVCQLPVMEATALRKLLSPPA
jgi:uncharacterized protein YyaL (SSP411 family)